MARPEYEHRKRLLQIELIKLQNWVQDTGQRIVIVFEGRDAAGKGGVIKRINQRLNPRVCRVVALPAPNDRERTQWYFQRYVQHLPGAGEIALFEQHDLEPATGRIARNARTIDAAADNRQIEVGHRCAILTAALTQVTVQADDVQ